MIITPTMYFSLVIMISAIGISSFYMDYVSNNMDGKIIEAFNEHTSDQNDLNYALVYNSESSYSMDLQIMDAITEICNSMNGCEIIITQIERVSPEDNA